jgi:hypothetical protein
MDRSTQFRNFGRISRLASFFVAAFALIYVLLHKRDSRAFANCSQPKAMERQ